MELADVVRQYGPAYLAAAGAGLSPAQRRALRAIAVCRTAALGGHVQQCGSCGHRVIAYDSCRNRHCPKCQAAARAAWLQARAAELLPVPYFHLVFTLPQLLAPLALANPRVVYGILFRATAATLLRIAADPRHLGAAIGFLAVLHTWGQQLQHHPHLHCIVPGGGLAPDRARWVACRPQFFVPVRVLSRLFRGKVLAALETAFRQGALVLPGALARLVDPPQFRALVDQARRLDWVVYAKPPFGGPEQVLQYLARYTHRVAITNARLLACADGQVTFRWKDYAHGNQVRTLRLAADEFLRRFLLHVLPGGFRKIRYFGFLANRGRQQQLARCRALLADPPPQPLQGRAAPKQLPAAGPPRPAASCPVCKVGVLTRVEVLRPVRALTAWPRAPSRPLAPVCEAA